MATAQGLQPFSEGQSLGGDTCGSPVWTHTARWPLSWATLMVTWLDKLLSLRDKWRSGENSPKGQPRWGTWV